MWKNIVLSFFKTISDDGWWNENLSPKAAWRVKGIDIRDRAALATSSASLSLISSSGSGERLQLMGNNGNQRSWGLAPLKKINERELLSIWTNVRHRMFTSHVYMALLGRHHSARGRKKMLWTTFLLSWKSRCKLNSKTFRKALLWNWSSNPEYRELQWHRLCWKRGKKVQSCRL